MNQTSLRESLEKSFEVLDEEQPEETGGPEEDTEEPVRDTEEETPVEREGETEDGELEGEESGGDDDDLPEGEGGRADATTEQVSAKADQPGDEEPPEVLKAPASWKPGAREHWKGLNREVQEEILRREGDIQKGMHQASQHRKVAEEYYGIVRPYENMIRAAGATPSQAINSMFSTAMTLTMGTPKQKAEMVRDIIQNYSVDIETLDQTLSGMELPDDENAGLMNAMREELAPIHQFMGQFTSAQQQQDTELRQQVNDDLARFAEENEFYEDVRETMADLMEVAGKRNRPLTLEDAYNQACQLNPEIKKVLAHREARGRAARPDKDEIQRKRDAASSVASTGPTGAKDTARASTLRGAIEQAFEDTEL